MAGSEPADFQQQETDPYWDSQATLYDQVQKDVFTNWINHQLRDRDRKVKDLQSDLDDGVILVNLLEVLALGGEQMEGSYQAPRNQYEEYDNLCVAFRFMTKMNIRLESIGPDNIREHNLKRILGLMWSIIHRYQIHTHKCTDEKYEGSENQDDVVLKTLLLGWLQASLPSCTINNLATDWNDGRNLSALVNYCRPDLIPDHAFLSPDEAQENIAIAMDLASEHFGIPKIMNAKDLAAEKPDARSVMLYLSQFCCPDASSQGESIGLRVLLEWIQQHIPKQNITNFTTDWMDGRSLGALTNAISGGGFPEYEDMDPADVVKNCRESIDAAERLLSVEATVSAEAFSRQDTNQLIRMTYLTYFRYVVLKDSSTKDTLNPQVLSMPSDASKCIVLKGPTIPPEITTPVTMQIDTSQAGEGMLYAEALGESGALLSVEIQAVEPGISEILFTAPNVEKYDLSVSWGDHPIPNSPFSLDLDAPKSEQVTLTEPPLLSVTSGQPISMCFDTSKGGRGELTAACEGKTLGPVETQITKVSSGKYTLTFVPIGIDIYTVGVLWAGVDIPLSPITINVNLMPIDIDKVKVIGPTLLPGDLVVLELQTAGAGKGEVSTSCLSSTSESVAVGITESSDSADCYHLRFKPPNPDVYTFQVHYAGMNVKGSPFIVDTTSTEADVVKESHEMKILDNPTECIILPDDVAGVEQQDTAIPLHTSGHEMTMYVGDSLNLTIETENEEQGKGDCVATAEGKTSGSAPITSEQKGDGTYIIHFDPTKPDCYTLSISLNGKSVPNSPFVVKYILRPDASKCNLVNCEGIPTTPELHKEITFGIDTSDAGDGMLSVTADGPGGEPQACVEVTPSKDNPKIYLVKYIPSAAGRHEIHVQWSHQAISGSPVIIEVGESESVPTYSYDEPVVIDIDVDCNVDDLVSHAIHQDSGSRYDVNIEQIKPGKFTLAISPNDPGFYLIYVLLNSVEIPGSPFKISYSPKPPLSSACKVSDVEGKAFVDEPIQFTVDTTEAGSGDLHVQVSGSAAIEGSNLMVADNENKTYTVTYIPFMFGDLQFRVTWSGGSIPGSPFGVVVKEKEPHVRTALNRDGIINIIEVDSPVILYISNVILRTAKCTGKVAGAINVPVSLEGTRCYRVCFSPRSIDNYLFTVHLESGVPFKGSPFHIRTVEKGSLSAHSGGEMPGLVQAGTPMNLILHYDATTILAVSTDGPLEPCDTSITGQVDGFLGLRLNPEDPGRYLINFKRDIPGSRVSITRPYTFRASKPDSGALRLRILQEDLTKFRMRIPFERGCCAVFHVSVARDIPPGALKIIAKGPGRAQIKVYDKQNGIYPCHFFPSIPGKYTISAIWNGDHIVGSAFIITFKPGRSRAITGLDLESETYYVGVPHHFKLLCSPPLRKIKPSIEVKPASAAQISVTHIDNTQSYQCEIVPQEVGNHEIRVLHNGVDIVGSPFGVSFEHRKSASNCKVIDNPAEQQYNVGDKISVLISTKEAGEGSLTAFADNKATGDKLKLPITCTVEEQEYRIDFCPEESSEYLLNILCDGEHIPESPIVIFVNDQPANLIDKEAPLPGAAAKEEDSPSSKSGTLCVKAYGPGLRQNGFVGQEGNFVIETGSAGEGKLDVVVQGPMGAFNTHVRHHPDNKRTILARYDPTTPGSYCISITWCSVHIEGSPFNVTIDDQPISSILANPKGQQVDTSWLSITEPVNEIFVGSSIEVLVKAERAAKQGEGELIAVLQSSKNTVIHASVTSDEDHNYLCKIDQPPVGRYMMHVYWAGEHVTGSPFSIKVMPASRPENVKACGPGLQDGLVGEEGKFTVETTGGGAGTLHIRMRGPKKTFDLDLMKDPENPRTILAQYNPSVAGEFTIEILWSDVHIPGSPFSLNIREMSEAKEAIEDEKD